MIISNRRSHLSLSLRGSVSGIRHAAFCLLLLSLGSPLLAQAGVEVPGIGGELQLDARARLEVAHIEGSDQSEAWTLRTRLAYQSATWNGFSGLAEVENIASPDEDAYFDAVSTPNGKSVVADPTSTELNRAYLRYADSEGRLTVTAGRQRIKLDDDRFVGNVGWRQNEQTYDAALVETSAGIDGLSLSYGYIWDVHRIFGDEGPAKTRDFDDSETHLLRAAWSRSEVFKPVLFAYLMDFEDSPGNSSDTFGLRVTGKIPAGEKLAVAYQASFAHQTDAGDNPVDYSANYLMADVAAVLASCGSFGVGYESLGSDDGRARFVTPLSTAHKFNGFADAFLDNGGLGGLRDAYVYVAPKLPWQLKGKLAYHSFESDHGGDGLGDEVDAVVSRVFSERVTVLAKAAHFEGDGKGAPADRDRFTLDASFKY